MVIMKETELLLVPLVGKRLTVPLEDIESVREAGNMYGKGFLWKRAFLLKAPQNKRIGFAVAPSTASRWRDRLCPGGGAMSETLISALIAIAAFPLIVFLITPDDPEGFIERIKTHQRFLPTP